jgi:hypothetical protein
MLVLGAAPEPQLVRFVRSWLTLLARDEWDAALAMQDEPNGYGILWTKDRIVDLLRVECGPETSFAAEYGEPRFSDPDAATGTPTISFGRTQTGDYWLDHDIPLNGAFSDLTVQWEFLSRAGGYAAVLHDLHVM